MAERQTAHAGKSVTSGAKPVPMNLFATWEVDRTSHNCIPRLCSLRLTRLIVLKPLESDLSSVVIAVKMQSMKRTLRSNEIFIPQGGVLDTDLDLSFSLQYPHFLKREGNKLQIMLQRRKRYKNRTILGFKTLAVGLVSMSQVLQKSVDNELNLYSNTKDGRAHVAQVFVYGLASQPVDQEDHIRRKRRGNDRSPDVYNYSDEDEESFSSDQEGSDSGDLIADKGGAVSLYLAGLVDDESLSRVKDLLGEEEQERSVKPSRGKLRASSRQRNFKQKFIALLKKFKVAEGVEAEQDLYADQDQPTVDDDFLDDDLDDLNVSDSGPEMEDNMSIESTPKPVLRPFFTSSQQIPTSNSQAEEMEPSSGGNVSSRVNEENNRKADSDSQQKNTADDTWQDTNKSEISVNSPSKDNKTALSASPTTSTIKTNFARDRSLSLREKRTTPKDPKPLERRNSTGHADNKNPRRSLPDQLSSAWPSEDQIPDDIILINTVEWQGQLLSRALEERNHTVICTCSSADVQATFAFIVNRIQKLHNGPKTKRNTSCNTNSANPPPLKLAVAGSDAFFNSVLRPYVEQFSAKSPDWQNYIRFLIIPLGANSLAKYLASVDNRYSSLFMDSLWREAFEKADKENIDYSELVHRVSRYLHDANLVFSLPIAEAMVNYRNNSEEDSVQKFVPFINDVRVGSTEAISTLSGDWEEFGTQSQTILSSSPPTVTQLASKESSTPPSSPAISITTSTSSPISVPASSSSTNTASELMDLQVEYWTNVTTPGGSSSSSSKFKDNSMKCSLKTTFRSLNICRLPSSGDSTLTSTLSLVVVTKEKNKKIMRIGKRPKETESKSQVVDGINRLICMCKSHTNPLKVNIDGMEWPSVKFFQISAQWSTHIKHFPLLMFAHSHEMPH